MVIDVIWGVRWIQMLWVTVWDSCSCILCPLVLLCLFLDEPFPSHAAVDLSDIHFSLRGPIHNGKFWMHYHLLSHGQMFCFYWGPVNARSYFSKVIIFCYRWNSLIQVLWASIVIIPWPPCCFSSYHWHFQHLSLPVPKALSGSDTCTIAWTYSRVLPWSGFTQKWLPYMFLDM